MVGVEDVQDLCTRRRGEGVGRERREGEGEGKEGEEGWQWAREPPFHYLEAHQLATGGPHCCERTTTTPLQVLPPLAVLTIPGWTTVPQPYRLSWAS